MKIGIVTLVQQSQYSTPVFIIPNKEGTVSFITDYLRINQKLVRKSYPLPRIVKTMQQLEGLQYETVLDLNMVYYTIRLFPASHYMTSIVTEFGKFEYNCFPMVMYASGDIFQDKVDDLLGNI